jgi:hypothetical protein
MITAHLESKEDRWQRQMRATLPAWIDAVQPATVRRTTIGVQLSVRCHCGEHRQVQARCAQDASQPQQAQLLLAALDRKHGACHKTTVNETVRTKHPLALEVDKLRTSLKGNPRR